MLDGTRKGYDAVSRAYAERFGNELAGKPMDREVLDGFAGRLAQSARIVDVGCGPGQIAAYLSDRGADVVGMDLSCGMVTVAREIHPGLDFLAGDMRALPFADRSLAAISAMYCIIHIQRDEIVAVLAELRRVLGSGGLLLMSFHIGKRVERLTEFLGHSVSIDFVFYERDEMERYLRSTGFEIEESRERGPLPDVEAQTRRAYLLAKRA
jgi:SAM-dependent methyltransferase